MLKWHRARRRQSDPVFTGRRILEGMVAGASVEVDLVVTRDKGFAVLHNLDIAEETTGTGMVADHSDAELRQLRLRDNDGQPIGDRVMLLEDLCRLMAAGPVHPQALLQLDYKQDESVLDARALANFRRATAPVSGNLILSSGSAAAVALLAGSGSDTSSASVSGQPPTMRTGYDPCNDESVAALRRSGEYEAFVADALAAAPRAEMIYLAWELVLALDQEGFDIVSAFHRANRRVDAWTIRTTDPTSLGAVERLLALKVDQITTDDPEGLIRALHA